MKTEREDFSSRALLAINMKKEMLRRMLHYRGDRAARACAMVHDIHVSYLFMIL